MDMDRIYAEAIANEYAPKNTSKVMALKKLDRKAKSVANIFAYTSMRMKWKLARKNAGNLFTIEGRLCLQDEGVCRRLVGHHGAFCALQWTSGSDRRLNLAREHLRVSPGAGRHPGFDAGAVCQSSQ